MRKSRMRSGFVAGLAATGLLLTGCNQLEDKESEKPSRDINPGAQEKNPHDDSQDSLTKFKENVKKKHVKIALGACAAWPNNSGKLTVTTSPGVGFTRKGSPYYIYSKPSPNNPKKRTYLNGPRVGNPSVMTLILKMKFMVGLT